jgi:CubicO group peptidase (beta-lactamase class C family)
MRLLTTAILILQTTRLFTIAQEATPLPRSNPETQGVSSRSLIDLVEALDSKIPGMHSLMIVRNGHVITEGWWAPYRAEDNHVLYSLSKSFTSTAVGFAVSEERLSIDDPVGLFFPDAMPDEASYNLKSMRVRDILTMTTGHQQEPSAAAEIVSTESFLSQEVPHPPGTHFKYNTAATFMQSAIVQKLTGKTVLDYLGPRLFAPLGIEKPEWDTNFQGISLGGYGLRVRTEDIAKLGQLYLQNGKWNGKQLIPMDWVSMATSKQVSNGSNPDNDWNQGYGFQFWRCRHNAYRGDGAFGQYCIVMPDQNAVIAITSGVSNMQSVMNVIWDFFLPACQTEALKPNKAEVTALKSRLTSLTILPAKGNLTSEQASRVLNRIYTLDVNEQGYKSIRINHSEKSNELTLRLEGSERTLSLPAGYLAWHSGRSDISAGRLAHFSNEQVAGTFAWEKENVLTFKICAIETPFHFQIRLRFEDDNITLESESNVAFGPRNHSPLKGKLKR